jgi:hypothetical protein
MYSIDIRVVLSKRKRTNDIVHIVRLVYSAHDGSTTISPIITKSCHKLSLKIVVPVVPSTDYIGIFHTKWTVVASKTGLSACVV